MRNEKTVRSFEGARGIAALTVALYHMSLHLSLGVAYPAFIAHGFVFVDLFFVLSGFVTCATYWSRLDSIDDLASFVVRRIARLFPLLLFATAAYVLTQNLGIASKSFFSLFGHADLFQNVGSAIYVIPSITEIISIATMTHGLGFFDRNILNWASWSIKCSG